jgi:hypothetical protein
VGVDKTAEQYEKKLAKMPPAKSPTILPIYRIPLHLLEASPWNPMEDSAKSLNNLTANIRQIGFVSPALVVPIGKYKVEDQEGESLKLVTDGQFRIISGHDRSRAALAAGMVEIPCVVADDFDEELQQLQTVRMNVIQKKVNPEKFMRLYTQFAEKYTEDIASAQMMFTDTAMRDQMIESVRKELPDSVKKKLDDKKGDIKSVDDLASVVAELLKRYGSQLDKGFCVFSYGGQEHVYFSMDKPLRDRIQRIVGRSETENRHVADILKEELGVTE